MDPMALGSHSQGTSWDVEVCKVRSLGSCIALSYYGEYKSPQSIFLKQKYLRVCDLTEQPSENAPRSITSLKHLSKIVNNRTDPHDALVSSIHKLIYESKLATKLAHQQGKSHEMDVCIAKFEDSIDSLKKSLKSLEDRDLPGLNVNLLAAMNDYN
ncbi:hypothetical protein SO802_010811 [Lithocarpus litseifolius]|uniref:Uncharacterized protein n=1 Tax=Lithocarpus litseifolius TaxID=425828 RepID=A0AAW2DIB6_9ROSI